MFAEAASAGHLPSDTTIPLKQIFIDNRPKTADRAQELPGFVVDVVVSSRVQREH